jgi:hypothetical protein
MPQRHAALGMHQSYDSIRTGQAKNRDSLVRARPPHVGTFRLTEIVQTQERASAPAFLRTLGGSASRLRQPEANIRSRA